MGDHYAHQSELLGWLHGEKAFRGPRVVQVDLANTCNSHCVACWLHSPEVPASDLPEGARRQQLPWELLLSLLDELKAMGTEEIYLAGGGEPLTHPRAWEAMKEIVARGFTCSLHTNFTLVDEEGLRRLLDLPVHHLTASVWAGTEKVYQKTHPGAVQFQFQSVLDSLHRLHSLRRTRPITKMYHVLSSANADDVQAMLEAAEATGCDGVEFAVADLIPGRTDALALGEEQKKHITSVLRHFLARERCSGPRLLGGEELFRRLQTPGDTDPGRFDASMVHRFPCTAGWTYARVMADGQVLPCLKAHRVPSGDLHHQSFRSIWEGEAQRRFRRETRVFRKDSAYFQVIGNGMGQERGCERGCDNLEENLATWRKWQALSPLEQTTLKVGARLQGGAGKEGSDER